MIDGHRDGRRLPAERGEMSGAAPLVIGLGNPILGDDGVGWRVAEEVRARLELQSSEGQREVEVDLLARGGLALMERMVGYSQVILVDSLLTGWGPAGTLCSLPLSALPERAAGHTASAHDTTLQAALDAGRAMGFDLPDDIWVVGVETKPATDFSDRLSPAVESVVPHAVEEVLRLLEILPQEVLAR